MTQTSSSTAQPSTLMNPESLAPYFDRLAKTQDEMTAAWKETQARTQRIGTEFMEAFLASQKQMLELARQMTLKPQDYAANIKAMVDASSTAQERALSLAKSIYKEQSDVAGELRKWMQDSMQAGGNVTEVGRSLMSFWTKQ